MQLDHPGTAQARLCATFGDRTGQDLQSGSAGSEPGSLTFLFRVIDTHKSNGANRSYYWVAGAVDRPVPAVDLWFPDDHIGSTRLPLVPLGSGWQGFAYEYSPPPPTPGRPPPEPSLVFTARGSTGAVVDSRRLFLDTGRSRRPAGPFTGSRVAPRTG